MTADKARKRQVRARMANTGEPYTEAARRCAENADAIGRIVDRAPSPAPSMELSYEVMTFYPGRDSGLAASGTSSWCRREVDALELADALVDFERGPLRVQVWEHNRMILTDAPVKCYQRDADAQRPPTPSRPYGAPVLGRPAAPDAALTAEPAWSPAIGESGRPKYALHVWTGDAWHTHSWHHGRTPANGAAAALRVAVDGGRYAFGYVSGPRFPRIWAHDLTQEGRECYDLIPDETTAEWAAREQIKRTAGDPSTPTGHDFEYESTTDLFRCVDCGRYEVQVTNTDKTQQPCRPSPEWTDAQARKASAAAARQPRCRHTEPAWHSEESEPGDYRACDLDDGHAGAHQMVLRNEYGE